ncbi:MucR family transcriptional regulator [Croceicoccus mobilis]|uniref:MucR family transcriptional regulator n=1 Tax=Croceicoccus mobilis TaxID=1703339 RepID=A0A916Z940_9SPHN|nr:MucR family transcriptional regulator [Croceicoccus mobilis]GGD82010.1 MucR family transcriptional regulator [Croceicoccus mobilis]
MKPETEQPPSNLIETTAEIVTAYLSANQIEHTKVPALIASTYAALSNLGSQSRADEEPLQPAVSIRASVKKDHIVCLEDGKKMKMLKRHLMTDHGLTPDEYRAKWQLPDNYPMVAPDYAETRRQLAKKIGLGRKPVTRRRRKKTT